MLSLYPVLFADVLGQDAIKQHLLDTYRAGRTAHAQILVGPEGCGALALALAYAQYLQCEQPSEQDACGHCSACRKMSKYAHPDLHFTFPTVGTNKISNDFLAEWRELLHAERGYFGLNQWLEKIKAENQQGNINKNECVEIVKRMSFKTAEGKYKIQILWLPEFLGKEGNRLLKLIEEPEPNTVFLLVAERPERILNTILSRCQIVKIPRLQDADIMQALQTQGHASPELAQRIAYAAEGNWTRALTILAEGGHDFVDVLLDWLRRCFKGLGYELVQWVEMITSGDKKWGRKDQMQFLQYGLFFWRETLDLFTGQNPDQLRLGSTERKAAQGLLNYLSIEKLLRLTQLFDEHCYFIERNGNPKLLFLDLSIQIHKCLKDKR